MSLETDRYAARGLVGFLLSVALASCSSTETPASTAMSGGTASSSAGSLGGPAAGSGGSAPAPATAGTTSTATGGAPTTGGAGGGSGAGSGGTSAPVGGTASGGAGGTSPGGNGPSSCATVADFMTWPANKGPTDIAKLAVNNFKPHTGDPYGGAGYAWTFAYVASLQFTKLTGDTATNAKLLTDFERYASGSEPAPSNNPPGPPGTQPTPATVDDRAFGDLPLEIFMENQDARSKKLGQDRADVQWSVTTSDGITQDARYWADDMFMITGLQLYAYRALKDSKYLDRSAAAMLAYLTALQQPDGSFWHTKQSKAAWGRANGWIAAGMTELLLDLPAGTARDGVMAGYKKQMDRLLALQIADGADAGGWRQVLDVASANPESSCTAMFTFALVTGVRNGWLTDPKYAAAARKGWLALGNKTNGSGALDKVCPGTGQADPGTLEQQQMFYTNIKLGSDDQHGQAPLMWAALALIRPDCPGAR